MNEVAADAVEQPVQTSTADADAEPEATDTTASNDFSPEQLESQPVKDVNKSSLKSSVMSHNLERDHVSFSFHLQNELVRTRTH
jgi:hypothetical protein